MGTQFNTTMAAAARMIAAVATGIGLLLASLQPASAEIAVSTTLTYPATAVVNTVVNASLAIANVSTSADDRRDVPVDAIFHTPSCGSGRDPDCVLAVPGVFRVGNAVGRAGTACAGTRFSAGPPQPFTGEVEFIPDHAVVLGPSHGHGTVAQCVLDFAVTVRGLPAIDSNPDAPGTQTAALARIEIESAATPSHLDAMFDALTEVTVMASACPDATPLLAAASACTVLQTGSGKPGDDKLTFGGHGAAIGGNVCVGPGSALKAANVGLVTGDVVLDVDPSAHATATCSSNAPGVNCSRAQQRDLGNEIFACAALAASSAAKQCTIGDYRDSLLAIAGATRTIAGAPGENVLCVKDVNLAKDQVVTLTGAATTTFVINVKGKFSINGGRIVVDGTNVQRSDVLYNVIGAGGPIELKGDGNAPAEIDGSLVASERDITLDSGRINGAVCGDGAMRFDGGSNVCTAARP